MLDDEIINRMDNDELRNYICHQEAVLNNLRRMNGENSEIIELLQRALYMLIIQKNTQSCYNARNGELIWLDRQLRNKYPQDKTPVSYNGEAPSARCRG